MKTVSVVILHYHGRFDTISCFRSLLRAEQDNFRLKIIVVDNASEDNLFKTVREKFPRAYFIVNKENLGFAGGNNMGIKKALFLGADYVFILNNDTLIHEYTISWLIKFMEDNRSCGILSPKIYFAKGYEFHKDRYQKKQLGKVIWYAGGIIDWQNVIGRHRGVDQVDEGQFNFKGETDFASGCAMMVRREVFETIGMFDERYFLYYEDLDFAMRAKRKGFAVFFYPKSFLWHKNAQSAHGVGSQLQDYYISRNRLLFGMNYAPFSSKLSLVKESVTLLLKGRTWQRIGVRDFYLRRLGKGSYS